MKTSFFKSRKNVITFVVSISLIVAILVTVLVLLLVKAPKPDYVKAIVGEYSVLYDANGVDTNLKIEAYTGKCSTYKVVVPEKITIGDYEYTVTKIGDKAFSGENNKNLKEATALELPATIAEIGDKAFESTTKLESLHIKGVVNSFGEEIFLNSGIKNLTIDNLAASYKFGTFKNKRFEILTINNLVGNINDFNSGYDVSINADTLNLGAGVTNVKMFKSTIKGVTTLSYYHSSTIFTQNFLDSSKMKTLYINGLDKTLNSDTLANIPTKAKQTIEDIYLSVNCDTINNDAFSGFSALKNVYLNEDVDVVTISLDAFNETNAKIVFETESDVSLNIRKQGDTDAITSEFMSKFSNVTKIKTVGIENGIATIAAGAFSVAENVNVIKFEMNSTVNTIETGAFGTLEIKFYGPTSGYVYTRLNSNDFKNNRVSYN